MPKHPPVFRHAGFCILPALLAGSELNALEQWARSLDRAEIPIDPDDQVDTARAHYSHQVTEFLLLKFAPVVEEVTGKKVFPTYSYMRIYKHGSELKKHKDRAACEFTLYIALGCDSRDPWPIHLDTGTGPRAVTISAGDGVLFRGCDLFHWRDRFEGTYCAQVFLHFVDQDGPAADQKFDGRAAIGAPASRTPGTNAG